MFNSVFCRNFPYTTVIVVLLLVAVLIPASEARIQWEVYVKGHSIKRGIEEASKTGKPIMMNFYTDWCDTCKQMKIYTFRTQHIIDLATNFICIDVTLENTTDPLNKELQVQYNVTSLPTILFIAPDDGLIERYSGYLPPDQLARIMERVRKKETNFQKALLTIQKTPNNPKLNKQIALTYLERKQLEKALSFSKKTPNDPELNGYIALAYLQQADLEKALPFAEKVFAKDPENQTGLQPKLHLEFGIFHINQGYTSLMDWHQRSDGQNFQKAAEHLQTVIDTYPKSDVYELALFYLAVKYAFESRIHATTGWIDNSLEILENLAKLSMNEKLKFQSKLMSQFVQDLADSYSRSIITRDYASETIKDLADFVKKDQ